MSVLRDSSANIEVFGTGDLAQTALQNTRSAYDFFSGFGIRGFDGNNSLMQVNIGASNSEANIHDIPPAISLEDIHIPNLAVVVHEFAHLVTQHHGGILYSSGTQTGVIHEAYSDIFALLIRLNDMERRGQRITSADWVYTWECRICLHLENDCSRCKEGMRRRNLANPSDVYTGAWEHTESKRIAHAAYIMWRSGISIQDLTEIWMLSYRRYGDVTLPTFRQTANAVVDAARGVDPRYVAIARMALNRSISQNWLSSDEDYTPVVPLPSRRERDRELGVLDNCWTRSACRRAGGCANHCQRVRCIIPERYREIGGCGRMSGGAFNDCERSGGGCSRFWEVREVNEAEAFWNTFPSGWTGFPTSCWNPNVCAANGVCRCNRSCLNGCTVSCNAPTGCAPHSYAPNGNVFASGCQRLLIPQRFRCWSFGGCGARGGCNSPSETNINGFTADCFRGTWVGEYDGYSGDVVVRRTFEVNFESFSGNNVSGTISFGVVPGCAHPATGSYRFSGVINYSTGGINFQGHTWINQPPNFSFAIFNGRIRDDRLLIHGTTANGIFFAYRT